MRFAAAVALAALFCASHAADVLYFDGRRCNTNWRNSANWDKGVPDDSGRPLLVKFASAREDKEFKPVKSRVQFGDYNVNKIQLASNMVLQLDSDDVLFRFESTEEPAETLPQTRFTGGQTYREECDFNCHRGWYLKEGTRRSTFQPKAPPCSRDVAVLDQECVGPWPRAPVPCVTATCGPFVAPCPAASPAAPHSPPPLSGMTR